MAKKTDDVQDSAADAAAAPEVDVNAQLAELQAKLDEAQSAKEAAEKALADQSKLTGEKLEELVKERVESALSEQAEGLKVLDAGEYAPLRPVTLVPINEGRDNSRPLSCPENNSQLWERVAAEDFTQEHAQRLIDHFNNLAAKDSRFNPVSAIYDQLGKRRAE